MHVETQCIVTKTVRCEILVSPSCCTDAAGYDVVVMMNYALQQAEQRNRGGAKNRQYSGFSLRTEASLVFNGSGIRGKQMNISITHDVKNMGTGKQTNIKYVLREKRKTKYIYIHTSDEQRKKETMAIGA